MKKSIKLCVKMRWVCRFLVFLVIACFILLGLNPLVFIGLEIYFVYADLDDSS